MEYYAIVLILSIVSTHSDEHKYFSQTIFAINREVAEVLTWSKYYENVLIKYHIYTF